jgi:hypothetical protein
MMKGDLRMGLPMAHWTIVQLAKLLAEAQAELERITERNTNGR